ncbi:MAG TPA: alpha-2-macroglobulin family protein, partial [Gillisia sp.]|nr:alpha-2-macroglobulin family protein [Gillisia sp.]
GKYQNNVRTQKELSVIPNAPRFLREGDTITFKARVTNLSEETLSGTAVLQLFNSVTMEPIDSELGNSANIKRGSRNSIIWC